MLPVLFSVGNFSISSFGVFLALGFLFGVFLVWRLSRAWDLDEEKILDLTLASFLGGLVGARLYFVLEHWDLFAQNLSKIFLFYKLPGFSFWGGILGGWLTLFYFSKKWKIDFWQIADIASVGLLGGLIFESLGCFLGGCGVGIPSNLFFAVPQIGFVGRRFPVQAIEALLLMFVLWKIWKLASHFHQRGKIISLTLIFISFVKLILEPFREVHNQNYFFSTTLLILGLVIFYKVTQRNPLSDLNNFLKFLVGFITQASVRKTTLDTISKVGYNQKALITWRLKNLQKLLLLTLRRHNVRS